MLKLTKTGIGLLTRQYRSVLKKCWAINVGIFAATAFLTTITPKIVYAERDGNNNETWNYGDYYVKISPAYAHVDAYANGRKGTLDESSVRFYYNDVLYSEFGFNGMRIWNGRTALAVTIGYNSVGGGVVYLSDNTGDTRIALDADSAEMVMDNTDNKNTVAINGNNGTIKLGTDTGTTAGTKIKLDGTNGILYLGAGASTGANGILFNGTTYAAGTHANYLATAGWVYNNYYRKEDLGSRQVIDFARYFKSGKFGENARFLNNKSITFDAERAENVPAAELRRKIVNETSKKFAEMPHNSPAGEGTLSAFHRKAESVMDNLSQCRIANDNFIKDATTFLRAI